MIHPELQELEKAFVDENFVLETGRCSNIFKVVNSCQVLVDDALKEDRLGYERKLAR